MIIIKKILNLEINDDYIRLIFLKKKNRNFFIDKSVTQDIILNNKSNDNEVSKSKYIESVTNLVKDEMNTMSTFYKKIYFNIQSRDIVIRNIEILNTKKKKDILNMIEFEITQYIPINISNYLLRYKVIDTNNDKLNIKVILFPRNIIKVLKDITEVLNMNTKNINVNFDILQKLISMDLIEEFSGDGVFIESKKTQFIVNTVKNNLIEESYLLTKEIKSYESAKKIINNFKSIYYYGIEEDFIEENFKNIKRNFEINPLKLNKKIVIDKAVSKQESLSNNLENENIQYISTIGMII